MKDRSAMAVTYGLKYVWDAILRGYSSVSMVGLIMACQP